MLAAHRLLGTWRDSIDSYITLTAFSRKKFIAAGFSPTKIFVKPNFIDPDPGHRALAGDYAVFTGRLSPEKGLMTLLRAWERLPVRCPLQIIGDGPEWRLSLASGIFVVSLFADASHVRKLWQR
jgi:glycosyltransferase involved in cell wall biosynthesis